VCPYIGDFLTAAGATMTSQMKRWLGRTVSGLMITASLTTVGCKHQLLTEPADSPVLRRHDIPATLEDQPHKEILPSAATVNQDPATVIDVKRTPKMLSLQEAMAIAVEQGNTGAAGGQGTDSAALPQFTGRGVSGTDTIKAFVLDPALAAAEVERSLSKFDARWINSMSWNKQDQATVNFQQLLSNGDTAAISSTLAKPLPTGGVAGITTSMNYLHLSAPPLNTGVFSQPATTYTPRVQFIFEQPLLQGFGVEANQLIANHPGSLLIQGFRSTGAGTEGILIARVRSEQSKAQFDVNMNQMLLNIEVAYWNLYSAYYNLYAQEEGYKQASRALTYNIPRDLAGFEEKQLIPQLETTVWQFYRQVIQARGQVLEADRVLRGLMGQKSDDGTIYIPADIPTRTAYRVNFRDAYEEGLRSKPEVLLARQELKAKQLELRAQQIGRMPDVRLFSSYDVNAVGTTLFGTDNGALSNLGRNQFNTWQVGIRAEIPLGFRDANALVRQGQLNMYRAYYTLSDSERKVFELLVQATRQLDQAYMEILAAQKEKEAVKRQVDIIDDRIRGNNFSGGSSYVQLTQAQQNLARARAEEFRNVAAYNSALARIEFAKGTIQRYNNIGVIEGALPSFVQTRATEHFKQRQAGLKLREHPAEVEAGNLSGYQLPNVGEMQQQLLSGTPFTPQPPSMPAPAANMSVPASTTFTNGSGAPASGTVQPYGQWKPNGTSPTSTPGTLPPISTGSPQFTQNGSVTLPKRNTEPGTPVNVVK
jgi:outer membrane protein TolC